MALLKSEKEEKRSNKEIGKYLIEGEVIEKSFGLIDRAYITNYRLIFLDRNLSLKDSKLSELVMVPKDKIDSVGIIKTSGIIARNAIMIRSRGYNHTLRFGKETDEIISFINEVSKLTLR